MMEFLRINTLFAEDNTWVKPNDFNNICVYANTCVLCIRYVLWSIFIHVSSLHMKLKDKVKGIEN